MSIDNQIEGENTMSTVAEHVRHYFSPLGWRIVTNAIPNVIKIIMIGDDRSNLQETLGEAQLFARVVDSLSSESLLVQACLELLGTETSQPTSNDMTQLFQGIRDAIVMVTQSVPEKDSYAFKQILVQAASCIVQMYAETSGKNTSDKENGVLALVKTALTYNRNEWMAIVSAIPNATAAVMDADAAFTYNELFKESFQEAQHVSELLMNTQHDGTLARACIAWYCQMSEMPRVQWELEMKLQIIRDAVAVVEHKSREEAQWYRQFVFDASNSAAEAYAEREGISISEMETVVLARIRQALGISV